LLNVQAGGKRCVFERLRDGLARYAVPFELHDHHVTLVIDSHEIDNAVQVSLYLATDDHQSAIFKHPFRVGLQPVFQNTFSVRGRE